MNAKSFHLSVQGASHIKKNKECQDAAISYYDENYAIAAVCDGHGGDDYIRSAYGSQSGVKAAEKNIGDFIKNIKADELKKNSDVLIKRLEASIINDWNEAIYKHYEENPFTDAELAAVSDKAKKKYLAGQRIESAYGTTMIAVGMTKDFWLGIQIGDGKCVAVDSEGRFLQPIPWDDKCFLNATTSICDSHALDNFRHFYSEELPIAVFVGTDGIDDCFKNDEQLNNLYKTVLYSFMTTEFDKAKNDLLDYLPRLSAKGSGDDVSLSVMIDFDRISDIDAVREFDREKEKAKVEELKKAEAQKAEEERRRVESEHRINNISASADDGNKPVEKIISAVCGTDIDDKNNYCGNCGAKITAEHDEIAAKAEISKETQEAAAEEPVLQEDIAAGETLSAEHAEIVAAETSEETLETAAEEPVLQEDIAADETLSAEETSQN